MKKHKLKTLSLTIDEINELLSIEDAGERREVAEALNAGAADPESVDPEKYLDAHPMALCLTHKISRRMEQRRRRMEQRAKKQAERAQSTAGAPKQNETPGDTISENGTTLCDNQLEAIIGLPPTSLEMNANVRKQLLWLNFNHRQWANRFFEVFRHMPENDLPRDFANAVRTAVDTLFRYLKPAIRRAERYHSIPEDQRPPCFTIPAYIPLP